MKRKQATIKNLFGRLCPVLLLSAGCTEFHFELFAKDGELEIDSVDNSVVMANTKFSFTLFNEIRRFCGIPSGYFKRDDSRV